MPFSIRHRNDPAPRLPPLPGLHIARACDPAILARVQRRSPGEMAARSAAGHRAYVARLEGDVAAWGWVATRTAVIGELGVRFRVPQTDRYLWNFVTRPAFRGRGIYPRLLDRIVERESAGAERFWVIHAPENGASGSGIRKAGFTPGGEISFDARNRPALQCHQRGERATDLLGLPVADGALAPCWRCARAGRRWIMFCEPETCRCDYQAPGAGCGS
jgi:GNAT superfamily N-acetyltransferase